MTRAKYWRTASRDSADALTNVLKTWNKEDYQKKESQEMYRSFHNRQTCKLFSVPLKLANDDSTSSLVRFSGSEKYACPIPG